jgi:hypothetical protein
MASDAKSQFWRISPGEDGYLWREQKLHECIAIGWSETGSARGKSKTWLSRRLKELRWPGPRACDQLAHFIWDVQKGDKVVASTSGRGIYALGTIRGDYEFNRELEYRHNRKVVWETTFWHPVDIDDLGLRKGVYYKFHGLSSQTIRKLEEDEWNHLCGKLGEVRTPFRNLASWGGLIQSPEYENEVIILFSQMLQYLRMRIVGFGTRFPDAIIERKDKHGNWRRLDVEFELYSSGFQSHMPVPHDKNCKTIICWEDDDWRDSRKKAGLEIIALKDKLEEIL